MPDEDTMSIEELANLAIVDNQPLVKYTDEDFADVSKVGDYLPRLQVMGSNSEAVKESKVTMGSLALVKDKSNPTEIGKEVDVVVISWHPKAMRIPEGGTPMSYFNRLSDEFKKVASDSNQPNSGCMFGPEFLLYIPSRKTFATFYMGSKTARKEAPNLLALMKKASADKGKPDGYAMAQATIRVKYIKTPKFSWHGPQVNPCTNNLEIVGVDPEEFREELLKFNNPPESKIEAVTEAVEGGRAR
jgi:hypothetical protein